MPFYQPGDLIKFTYQHKVRDQFTGPARKEVLVLNNNWQGKLHGIDITRLTAAEREVLFAVFNPKYQHEKHHLPLVNDINQRMNVFEECKNPMSFYQKFVRVFLQHSDAYRTYWPKQMSGVQVLSASKVSGTTYNPKPLFPKSGKGSVFASNLSPQQRQDRMDKVKSTSKGTPFKTTGKKKT